MPKENLLKKIAINEKSEIGFIMEIQELAGTKIYMGIPLTGTGNWVSINPNVFDAPVNALALMEIAMHVSPPKKLLEKKNFSIEKTDAPIAKWDALFTMEPGSDLNNIINSLFKLDPDKHMNHDIGDFHVDNEDEEETN